jgi:hypothetical protein
MPELQKHRNVKTILPNETILRGFIEITGGAGAINAQSGQRDCGVTFVKNATAGRYDGTLHRSYRRAGSGYATVAHPTAGTVPTPKDAFLSGIAAAAYGGSAGFSTFTIQCTAADGTTATNPAAGEIVLWELVVSDSPRA